jgi:hypothetical protein
MNSVELFRILQQAQATPEKVERCRLSEIEFFWMRNCLGYRHPKSRQSILVSYRPEGLWIRFGEKGKDKESRFWIAGTSEAGESIVSSHGEQFPADQAAERLWQLIDGWLMLDPIR